MFKSQRKQTLLVRLSNSRREGKGSWMNQMAMAKHHHPHPSVDVDVNLKLNRNCSLGTYDDAMTVHRIITVSLKWINLYTTHTIAHIQRREITSPHADATPNEGCSPSEYCNQRAYVRLQAACQRKSSAAGQGGYPLCLGSSPSHCRLCPTTRPLA